MAQNPDLTDPRYLREVGWFVLHEQGLRDRGLSYDDERLTSSRELQAEVLGYCGQPESWLEDKTVVSVGCSCSAELAAWPAAAKIGVDPLLNVYAELGLVVDDVPGTARTVYIVAGAEQLPLPDECADLVLCRDVLDRTLDPERSLDEIWRILRNKGLLFLAVNLDGLATPSEPIVFSPESVSALLTRKFEVVAQTHDHPPTNRMRVRSTRVLARKAGEAQRALDHDAILEGYGTLMRQGGWKGRPRRGLPA